MAAEYTLLIKKTAGWEPIKSSDGNIVQSADADGLLAQYKDLYPSAKVKLLEVLSLEIDFSWSGGSTGDAGTARTNLSKKLLYPS